MTNQSVTICSIGHCLCSVFAIVAVVTFRCDIPVVFYKLNTKYNYQSKHNKNYCIVFYNMFYYYMFRPFSLGHLQVVYTRS